MDCLSSLPRSLSRRSFQCIHQQALQQQTRTASTFRRSRTELRVPPAPSFVQTNQTQDHIIYNPPSSAPNVYHTPLKFLPKSDPRRRLHQLATAQQSSSLTNLNPGSESALPTPSASSSSSSSSPSSQSSRLPPPVRPIQEKKYHLTKSDVEEIRRLRTEDPKQWTRVRLAEKFGCSQFFVSLCASAPEIKKEREAELEAIKSRWGRGKREAREDRQTRKERWGRGQ